MGRTYHDALRPPQEVELSKYPHGGYDTDGNVSDKKRPLVHTDIIKQLITGRNDAFTTLVAMQASPGQPRRFASRDY